ncbi:hypothetical protein JK159_03845 [Weissella minor]|uniref:hypothetical protein n=1 Tax=Weissella minor TaxID=1620 RepID=UPI001BAED3C5|nr:hypothetical protein [Weissella minor]MBS0949511.1 hypothetical protein [Weissella minor]
MKLSQINTEFNYRMNLITSFYERLQTHYLIETFTPMKLKYQSLKYDRMFYVSSFENIMNLKAYLNGALGIMEENHMAELETNKPISKIDGKPIFRLPFVDFETDLQNYFVRIDQTLSKVNIVLNVYFDEDKQIGSVDD